MNNKVPAVFLGHGSPLNALEDNSFTQMLGKLGAQYLPKAIVMVSAHWVTRGTFVTAMRQPRTIHDFYGFPQPLFEIQYPAHGSSELAREIKQRVKAVDIQLDESEWGLDHGTWSVLMHAYPSAQIPVVQLSLDLSLSPAVHFKIGEELAGLRSDGVMIMGSGNLVHNLRLLNWDTSAPAHPWAREFDKWTQEKLLARDFRALNEDFLKTEAGRLSVPTLEHYLPLQYVLGASSRDDNFSFLFEEVHHASISMRSFLFSE